MKVIDVHDEYAHLYTIGKQSIQKATSHGARPETKKQLYSDTTSTVLLMDESCFLRYHMTINIAQSTPYTRSQYKELLTEKIHEVQKMFMVKPEQLTYVVKNMSINRQAVSRIIGESGAISFHICFFALDNAWSDIAQLKHVRSYPRWYFLLSNPLLAKKDVISVLVIDGNKSSLIHLENGRYKKIAHLNGGDDLLRQAYEQAGLDPLTMKHKKFSENSIGDKLLLQAHEEFASVLVGRAKTQVDPGNDIMVMSRLIEQEYFIHTLSKEYIQKVRGRVIPYRGTELFSAYERKRDIQEIPLLLLMEKVKEKQGQ